MTVKPWPEERKNLGATYYGGLFYPNRAPFAAVGDRVYVATQEGKLLAPDAETGKVVTPFETAYHPGVIPVDRGVRRFHRLREQFRGKAAEVRAARPSTKPNPGTMTCKAARLSTSVGIRKRFCANRKGVLSWVTSRAAS